MGAHPFAQAHVLLFGIFGLAGVPGMLAIDRRTRRRMGPEEWQRLAARTSLLPGSALLTGRWRADPRRLSWPRLALGVLHYAAILLLHRPVIGVSPRRVL